MLGLFLIVIGILLRFAPHAPNFTPVAAIALFGGAFLSRKNAIIIPLLLMIISDLFMGLHNVVLFTWGGFILISIIGTWIKRHRNIYAVGAMSLVSSFVFYLVSNFGVWVMGWYPHTTAGLINCFVMGIPFLRVFTLSTLLYTAAFFGVHELVSRLVKNTKLASVLLTDL